MGASASQHPDPWSMARSATCAPNWKAPWFSSSRRATVSAWPSSACPDKPSPVSPARGTTAPLGGFFVRALAWNAKTASDNALIYKGDFASVRYTALYIFRFEPSKALIYKDKSAATHDSALNGDLKHIIGK